VKLPRDLSGRDRAKALVSIGAIGRSTKSAAILFFKPIHRLLTASSVPAHDELRIGTLNAILRAVTKAKAVSREEVVAKL
jgi:hypothetical protein